jgi:hypothetical protein
MSDLKTAIDKIRANIPVYQRYINYYEGKHDLAFASDKFRNTFGNMLKTMRENLCPIVVDAPADRMEIINFASGDETSTMDKAWKIWQDAQMEYHSNELHKEAFKCGDAFLIVEPNTEGKARFYVQDSRQCTVIYDDNTGVARFGAKMWATEDSHLRVTLYYADRIEKWITRNPHTDGIEIKAENFTQVQNDTEEGQVTNTYGIIPMFHFHTGSILPDAIPMQDRLNKTICDELVAQEFAAFPQRWATGLDVPTDPVTGKQAQPFQAGAGNVWYVADESGKAKFGEFGEAELRNFLAVEDAARLSVARVTGTPLHFFSFTTSDAISGEALKTLEARFTKRVKRTSLAVGPVWGEAMKLALRIEGESADASITPQWAPAEQRSEKEFLETLSLKADLGVPEKTLWEEMGYSAEDIAKFEANEQDEAVRNARLMPNEEEAKATELS